jgi:hypothetical protein
MGIAHHASAPRTAAWLIGLASVLAACGPGGASNIAARTPSPAASPSASAHVSPSAQPSASPSPQTITGAYAVLYGSQAAASYTVSIVYQDGMVWASAEATTPQVTNCGNGAAAVLPPPVSTSNTRVYFMDAKGVVRYLAPNKDTGQATTVPAATASRRSMFAVSPDDTRIAVVVDDFTSTGASTHLYVEDLNGGGNHVDIYSESGSFTIWPVGWHGTNNLVVAKVPACTQGGGPFCCGPLELHVVDPATGTRRFTLGGSSCVIAGSPSPAGVACEDNSTFKQATVLNWTAGTVRTLAINGPSFVYVSPGGSMVAFVDNTGTSFTIGGGAINGMFACSWIDDQHVISGGDPQHQPRIADVGTGTIMPVQAQGDCAGRLPGGL